MSTAYDEVLYPDLPLGQTHPDRLATIATLFGMEPAPLARCRVLEIGCGAGANLIPMAFQYPNGEFLGIDAAEVVIRAGNREIEALGLTNIRLEHCDIMDAAPPGSFDYVIAHGFYSWVPQAVRERLMAMVQTGMAPHGVAYISYNALPGGRLRQMFRDMMLFHLDGAEDLELRVRGAREMLRWFVASQPAEGENGLVRTQVESVTERPPQCLYHDELGEIYYPVYFRDFVAHAARYGLQFLSEANYHDMQPGKLPPAVVAQVERASAGDRIRRDQYFDFLKCRMFRQTLLCHAGIALPDAALSGQTEQLYATSVAKPVSAKPNLKPGVAEEFRGTHGARVTTAHPFSKAVMQLLSEAWPETLSFSDLLTAAAEVAPQDATAENLGEMLIATYAAGVTELHTEPARCVSKLSRCPVASPLARSQARRGKLITTTRHSTIEAADEKMRQLITLLDGTHDFSSLAAELGGDLRMPEAELLKALKSKVELLGKAGLLVG
jgi:methyltransferase-like protein